MDLVPLSVRRVVQHRVGVREDIFGADAVVAVVLAELPQPPIGDVADPLAVRRVDVEREALGIAGEVEIGGLVCSQHVKRLAVHAEIYDLVGTFQIRTEYVAVIGSKPVAQGNVGQIPFDYKGAIQRLHTVAVVVHKAVSALKPVP